MFTKNAYTIKRETVCAKFRYFLAITGVVILFAFPLKAQVTIEIDELMGFSASENNYLDVPIIKVSAWGSLLPEMEIYPNPFSSLLQIDIESGSDPYYIEILDGNANAVFESSISSLPTVFEDVEISPGTYFLKLRTNQGIASATIVREEE